MTRDDAITVFKPGHSPAEFFGTPDGSGIQPDFGTSGGNWEGIDMTSNGASWQDEQYGADYNHSKGHHQQYMDLVRTTMFRNDKAMMACFACHDAHGSDNAHQLKERDDNNASCLTCHNGEEIAKGGFDNITVAMVDELIASGTTDPAIASAIEEHMATNADMSATYAPESTGVGRCSTCHMPKTSKTARWHDMSNGWRKGDMRSHTFDVMSAEAVATMYEAVGTTSGVTPTGFTNSCGPCHELPN